jgi:hypothetical protein
MMLDLGPFSSDNFDPKKWINAATQSRHSQESVDEHLAELESKLQMVSEEIAASLEEQGAAALLRVPRATRDVLRLREDAVSLRSGVSAILQKLKKVIGFTNLCVVCFFSLVAEKNVADPRRLEVCIVRFAFLFNVG